MLVIGLVCLIITALLMALWIYRRISISKKYIKTVGEIINVKNIVPLVDKRQVFIGKNYAYTECKYHGDVYVTVKFINREGEELTRRYNSSEPVILNINEHKRTVTQYTCIFPEWQIGKRIKIYYNPQDTMDIFVGKTLRKPA